MDVRGFLPGSFMSTLRWTHQSVRAPFRRIRFTAARLRRSVEPRAFHDHQERNPEAIQALEGDGFAFLPGAFEKEGLANLRMDIDTALADGLVYPVNRNPRMPDQAAVLTDAEVEMGENYIKKHANIIYIRDPLITCPAMGSYVFSNLIIDIATTYYGCRPSITGCYLMKSFVNELPEAGFNLFHSDNQSSRFIKFFFYLNDVEQDGGPFCYVPQSHRRKPLGWRANNTRSLTDIEGCYGAGSALKLTAKIGDLIVADTTGFHRAEKPKQEARYALMVNTGIHPIPHTIAMTPRISRTQFERLSAKQREIADFMQIV